MGKTDSVPLSWEIMEGGWRGRNPILLVHCKNKGRTGFRQSSVTEARPLESLSHLVPSPILGPRLNLEKSLGEKPRDERLLWGTYQKQRSIQNFLAIIQWRQVNPSTPGICCPSTHLCGRPPCCAHSPHGDSSYTLRVPPLKAAGNTSGPRKRLGPRSCC